jgi:hypothetical protein
MFPRDAGVAPLKQRSLLPLNYAAQLPAAVRCLMRRDVAATSARTQFSSLLELFLLDGRPDAFVENLGLSFRMHAINAASEVRLCCT